MYTVATSLNVGTGGWLTAKISTATWLVSWLLSTAVPSTRGLH